VNQDAFDERKTSHEAKYKMDEELRFKARARRNKLLGLWCAERLGLEADAAADYARGVVMKGMEARDDQAFIAALQADLAAGGAPVPEASLREALIEMGALALEQIAAEFPKALDRDHRRVGD
jgi:hypothetical protein